ncbi:MAG: hypothetical protein LJE62_16185 [Silicimonas sp.]|nr:hypothetical protein [Silicimonas sp.]
MSGKPIVRLYLFFATENNRAVVVRQGPTRHFRMILWHRDGDTFEDGQWLTKNLYPERCALSPDGRHFLYFMLDGKWQSETEGAYSAISYPPYWTAVSVFPCGDTWGGGGFFLDSTHYYAVGDADIIGRDEGLSRVKFGEPEKGCTTGIRLTNGQCAPLSREVTRRILADPVPAARADVFERAPAPGGDALDRYDTLGGMLYRRRGQELELIRDFTDMAFEPVRAPYDWRPEAEEPWHPLKDEK